MILFGFIATALVMIALLFVLPPLFRSSKTGPSTLDGSNNREKLNIAIAKERLSALKNERDDAIIDDAAYQRACDEIEQQLFNELAPEQPEHHPVVSQTVGKKTALLLVLLIPLAVVILYRAIGTPKMITPPSPPPPVATAPATTPQSIEAIVAKLAQQMEKMPDNIDGWVLLGRSYMRMQEYSKAADALGRAYALKIDNPTLIVQYVDALVMAQQGQFKGKPTELLQQALQLNPNEPLGLWMGGMAAAERGDFTTALIFWHRLKPLVAKDPIATQQLDEMIAEVKPHLTEQSATKQSVKSPAVQSAATDAETPSASTQTDAAAATVKVDVTLAPELAQAVEGETTLFILAQALNGPPMPLAVVRKQVKDLPLSVTLSDAMAMMPTMKLSAFKEIKITARISKSGQAMSRPGDLFGEQAPVVVGDKTPVQIVINRTIPEKRLRE